MKARENNYVEAYKSLVESRNRRSEEKTRSINEALANREKFKKEYHSIREARELKQRRHGTLMEACRNNAFGTTIKAIYITALEANTLTDSGIILAETMVDNWIKENGGASKILSECQNKSYLLARISQIVEQAAIIETEELENIEDNDIDPEEETTEEESSDNEVALAAKVIEDKLDAENDEEVKKALEVIKKKAATTADAETPEPDANEDESAEKDDTLNPSFDDAKAEEEEPVEEPEKDESAEENKSDDDKAEEEEPEKDESAEENKSDDDKAEEEEPVEEPEKDESAEENKSDDAKAEDSDDDTLNPSFDDEESDESEDSKDVEIPDDATTTSDDNETDVADDITDDIEDTPDEDLTVDGNSENNGEVFDELEKEEDIKKAIDLIRQRVADAEETFIKRNAEDKKQIDELIGRISDNVQKVEDIDDEQNVDSKIAQESVRMAKQKITRITEGRPLTIMEKMTRNLHESIIKDQVVKEQYINENGSMDTALIVESAKVMYGFLETLNTLQLEKVNSDYIKNIIDNM